MFKVIPIGTNRLDIEMRGKQKQKLGCRVRFVFIDRLRVFHKK